MYMSLIIVWCSVNILTSAYYYFYFTFSELFY